MFLNNILFVFVVAIAIICTIVGLIILKTMNSKEHIEKRPINKQDIPAEYPVSMMVPDGRLAVFSLHQPGDPASVPYGWAMVTGNDEVPGECILWMIYIRERYRRNGYAKALIRILQSKYDRIVTQYERGIINSAGVRLCISCGFELKRQMFKNIPADLIWTKKGK